MDKNSQTILERDRMRYQLFVQGNISSTAMTQLFVAIELKLKIEEVRSEFERKPRSPNFVKHFSDAFHLTILFSQVHFFDNDFVNETVTARVQIPSGSTLDEISRAVNFAVEKCPLQLDKKPYTRGSFRVRLNLFVGWLILVTGIPFEGLRLYRKIRWELGLRELSERNCLGELFKK